MTVSTLPSVADGIMFVWQFVDSGARVLVAPGQGRRACVRGPRLSQPEWTPFSAC